jgi:NADPH-dependent curcumin reductase CurA
MTNPTMNNRRWLLRRRPEGLVSDEDFELVNGPRPALTPGGAVVRTLYFSFDPTQRGWLNDAPGYMPPVQIGEAMKAAGIGQVVESNRPDLKPGDLLQGLMTWEEYFLYTQQPQDTSFRSLQKISADVPLTDRLSVFGLTGTTAYFGMTDVGAVRAGDVVVVSGAAGATGSIAGQIAKIKGAARVIGIAGGAAKCQWLLEKGGFDAAIDYRSEKVGKRLRELAPQGVDLFFDNVGGDVLDAVLLNLAFRARVVICGGISSGYGAKIAPGPKHYMQLVFKSARMEGFLLLTYTERMGEAVAQLKKWVAEGRLKYEVDIAHGIEQAPATLRRLFEGKNFGKQLLAVAEPLPPGGS